MLEAGTVTETVEVARRRRVVQTEHVRATSAATSISATIETLPIVGSRGRNPLTSSLTQPGVVSGANTGGGMHVNGARDRSWNFTLDGIDINETSAGGCNFSPLRTNPDSLAEFKVLTGNITAEFGRNSGGQVAMVTRSGTNRFSGTGFYFGRRPEFNANEWENNIDGLPKRIFKQDIPRLQRRRPDQAQQDVLLRQPADGCAPSRPATSRARSTPQQARQGFWRYVDRRPQPAGRRHRAPRSMPAATS